MQVYSYSQVLEKSTEYFNGDEFAAKVFADKYALQNTHGEYLELTPTDMHHRLSKEFARIENKYPNPLSEDLIFNLLDHFKYIIPQGSPMSAIGNTYQMQSLSNCFVIQGVHSNKLDSYGGIMLADQELVQIMKRRGGVGLDISGIRPKDSLTANAARTTDGIAVFMERFSNTCREVAQNGRRGAEMITISVNHPEIEAFINIKKDLKKVTGANISIRFNDEFMNAVKNNMQYDLRWPVDVSPKDAKIVKTVEAKHIWNQLIDAAWSSAEPGVLFWDNVKKTTPSDIYSEEGYESISTNPCFSGDTLIAVADGRNAVSIKQLAEEEKDVPVYSMNKQTGILEIKMGRHPRITGYNKKLIRVWLDDNSYLDTTPDHKFILLNGQTIEAKNLKNGDSLPRFTKSLESVKTGSKDYYLINCDTQNSHNKRIFEHRMIAKFHQPEIWDNIYNLSKQNGFAKKGGLVVHHKDYNSLNNSSDNLQIMTFKDHSKLRGLKDNNGNYSEFTYDEIKQHATKLTKQLGRAFSTNEWVEYASKLKLPQSCSLFRKNQFVSIVQLAKLCAAELNFDYLNEDPNLVKTYHSMLLQGYNARIINNKVMVNKNCEICKTQFEIDHLHRESSICSINCRNIYLNLDTIIKEKRNKSCDNFNQNKMIKIKTEQSRIYSKLKFDLKRNPSIKEWENACRQENVAYRIDKVLKFGFKNFKEVSNAGDNYNHKVIKIEELDGEHTVYNLTVDDNHTLAAITKTHNKRNNNWYSGILLSNCGEIVLSKNDACRLLVLNLSSYVTEPFTKNASFDYEKFYNHTIIAQRLMDDIIDLEIECVDRIINKIKADPEPEEVKQVELNLWEKIKVANLNGRRTGLGITALGDCFAMMNIKYGEKVSIDTTYKIYRHLAVAAHTSSCIMASERGAFPIFNYKKEKNHEYLKNIFHDADSKVRKMWKESGRRNIALTTTAPTGSVSTLTQTTSGIEPAYLLSYVRRKKINPSDKNAKVDFVDAMGDKWQEFTIYHHGVKKWMDVTGETDITKSPYFGATSNDIDWVSSVELQAEAQKSVDHSISKTCNLPNSATKEIVSNVYMKAWESGCKGITVYRDGSRAGVLLSESNANKTKNPTDRPTSIKHMMAPKRSIELVCDIKKAKVNGEAWTIFVGLLNNKPYEIFGGLSKFVDIPNKHKVGKIVKNGKNSDGLTTYNLLLGDHPDDNMSIKDIANIFENKTHEAFTRMISLNLRHGTPIQYVVEQLTKDKYAEMTSFSKVVARVLKSYIEDGSKANYEKKCISCSAEGTLVYQEGCVICTSCKYSRCN